MVWEKKREERKRKGFHYSCEKWTHLLTCLVLGLIILWKSTVCKELAYYNRNALKFKLPNLSACSDPYCNTQPVCRLSSNFWAWALVLRWGLWGADLTNSVLGFHLWQHHCSSPASPGIRDGTFGIRDFFGAGTAALVWIEVPKIGYGVLQVSLSHCVAVNPRTLLDLRHLFCKRRHSLAQIDEFFWG